MKVKANLIKKAKMQSTHAAMFAPGDKVSEFNFIDNGGGSYSVQGVSAAGNPVDISAVATLSVVSDDPGKVIVDSVTGMTFNLKAAGPVTIQPVNVTVTATWNDASTGPFDFKAPANVIAGPAAGIQVVELGPIV